MSGSIQNWPPILKELRNKNRLPPDFECPTDRARMGASLLRERDMRLGL